MICDLTAYESITGEILIVGLTLANASLIASLHSYAA
jgi:hypothetical protein